MIPIDNKQYPTLATYEPKMIEDAVQSLLEKNLVDTEEQALLNLEMSLAEQEQLARG